MRDFYTLLNFLYISDDGDFGEDLLSELPDEILISILSRLTLREAAATSVLSQRWRYLWTYTSRLNFDSVVNKIVRRSHSFALSTAAGRRRRRRKYIKWVHKVLAKYRGGRNLDEFRVCFDLSKRSRSDIDKWFEFAMSKNVKNLEFDFLRCSSQNQDRDPWFVMLSYFQNFYKFPHRILGVREARDPNGMFVGFKSLKTLSLKSINVSSEAVEYFLSNCPLLERLSVHGSESLVNLRVAGPSIMLRHLEIVKCSSIQTIEICDTNLVSFTYRGERKGDLLPNNMHIENSPLLVEVLAGVGRLGFAKNMLLKLSSCVHQLQILQLTVDHFFPERSRAYLLPKLRNLKQLKLTVFVGCPENCLLGFVAMLKKCPHLESLVLQVDVLLSDSIKMYILSYSPCLCK
ncbi:unnamed protein product, partial [Vitis vinifera]